MLEEILQTDSLGDRRQIEYILDVVEHGPTSIPALMEACFARSYGYRRSFRSLVKLLSLTGYLRIEEELVSLGNKSLRDSGEKFVETLCTQLFAVITESGELHHMFNNETLSIGGNDRRIYFRNARVPLSYAPLRNLMVNLGLMVRDPNLHNVFTVAEVHDPWFREGLPDWIGDSSTAGKTTLQQFKEVLKKQEEAGRLAEEYVVEFERRRLVGHPRADRIRRISDLDVGAGYDVQSFMSLDSAIIDRFIEVKSYSGKPSFYWSSGEVGAAKRKGSAYLLCLVDRDRMANPDYCPSFIRDPASQIFSSDVWAHACERHYFERD